MFRTVLLSWHLFPRRNDGHCAFCIPQSSIELHAFQLGIALLTSFNALSLATTQVSVDGTDYDPAKTACNQNNCLEHCQFAKNETAIAACRVICHGLQTISFTSSRDVRERMLAATSYTFCKTRIALASALPTSFAEAKAKFKQGVAAVANWFG